MEKKKIVLTDAYSLKTSKDSINLYKNWASTYDKDFAENSNYLSHLKISNFYNKYKKSTDIPILDVGAGTGLIGNYLNKRNDLEIIGIDISSEMLNEAKIKNCYNSLIEADITKDIPLKNNSIGAIVSAGTFTHGHVGPEAIDELLRITKPNGLFVLSIHSELFVKGGFEEKFIKIKNQITKPILNSFNIYGKNNDIKHGNDKALAVIFRKINEFTKIHI